MSVASELTKLADNMNDAYDAVEAKGGTVPATKTMAGLSTAIATIPSGGGGSVVHPKFVSFYRAPAAGTADLSWLRTDQITYTSYMFAYAEQTTPLDLSNFDTSNWTTFSYMFYNAKTTAIDLSSFRVRDNATATAVFSSAKVTKIFVPTTFRIAPANTTISFFNSAPSNNCDIYTPMTAAQWSAAKLGTVNAKFTIHYEATHADYEAA